MKLLLIFSILSFLPSAAFASKLSPDQKILVVTFKNQKETTTRCEVEFQKLSEWKEFKEFYLRSLEGESN